MFDSLRMVRDDGDDLEPVDVTGNEIAQLRPVETGFAQRPAIGRRIVQRMGKVAGIDQQLLGHAAPDHAGPADPELLSMIDKAICDKATKLPPGVFLLPF